LGSGRRERGVAQHLGDDAEGPDMEARIEKRREAGGGHSVLRGETRLIPTLVVVDLEEHGEFLVALRPDTRLEPLQLMAEAKCDCGIFDRVTSPVADEVGGPVQRLAHLGEDLTHVGVEQPEVLAFERGVAGDPLHASDELRERRGSSGGSRRWVGSGAELRAQPFER
jgi:hypothetical protein